MFYFVHGHIHTLAYTGHQCDLKSIHATATKLVSTNCLVNFYSVYTKKKPQITQNTNLQLKICGPNIFRPGGVEEFYFGWSG